MKKPTPGTFILFKTRRNLTSRGSAFRINLLRKKKKNTGGFYATCCILLPITGESISVTYLVSFQIENLFKLKCFY